MNPAFAEPGPYTFKLQRGRAVNDDDWEDVAQTIDQPWAYDNYPKLRPFDNSTFYRVILTDGNGKEWTSQPVAITTDWNHYDWSRMKEIVRKETLLLKKAGSPGWLLKRRQFGEQCECVDPNTGTVHNSACPDCFGTGIEGGYYDALDFPVITQPDQRLRRLSGDAGLITMVFKSIRALAWAVPEGDDVWVNATSNERFFIGGDIKVLAQWRSIDVVLDLKLTQIESGHPIYNFPTPVPNG